MKNKKLAYILVPATVLVWGLILYKVYKNYFAEPEVGGPVLGAVSQEVEAPTVRDTFTIVGNYRDPFLGRTVAPAASSGTATGTATGKAPGLKPGSAPAVKKQEGPVWPAITYGGVIRGHTSQKEVALININGQHKLMQKGEAFEAIKVHEIYKDSVLITMNKESRMFNKSIN